MCELFDFFDAARLAGELLDRTHRHDAVVLFRGCRPERIEILPPDADVFSMIDRAVAHASSQPLAFQTLFLRSGLDVGETLAEGDLALFRLARRRLATHGIDLLDWVHSDGELVRSMSYAADPARAWLSDDEAVRGEALHLLARHALAWSWGCGGPLEGLRPIVPSTDELDPEG